MESFEVFCRAKKCRWPRCQIISRWFDEATAALRSTVPLALWLVKYAILPQATVSIGWRTLFTNSTSAMVTHQFCQFRISLELCTMDNGNTAVTSDFALLRNLCKLFTSLSMKPRTAYFTPVKNDNWTTLPSYCCYGIRGQYLSSVKIEVCSSG